MSHLVLRAYLNLIDFDLFLARGTFSVLYERVREYPLAKTKETPDPTEKVCSALDAACIWYWKQVLCLQRAAATTCLLKAHGVPARMMIGVQQMPFKAHAWVEVDGRVVNDKSYTPEIYTVLDQC
jgi:hypothetical protein